MPRWRNLAVFVAVTAVYESCPIKGVGDLFWALPTAVSVLREGNTDLDEYEASFGLNPVGIERVDGHARNAFPIGPTLVALAPIAVFDLAVRAVTPVVQGIPKLARDTRTWRTHFDGAGQIDASFFFTVEMVLASLLMALAAVVVQQLASERLPWTHALAVTAVFAFGTSVWSTASRDLGQHGPSVLMLACALWMLVRAERVPSSAAWVGLFVALAYVMRPTNSLSVAVFTVLVALKHRRFLPAYCGLVALVLVPFALYNLGVYGAPLPPYYRPERVLPASASLFFEALAGNLVSPARGLLVFSPVLAFAALGLARTRHRAETIAVGTIVVLHWLVVSAFPHWWAGHSYGPRYMTDLAPYLCFLLIPVVAQLRARRSVAVAFALTFAFSAFTHFRGASSQAAAAWNATPADVDQHPARLWDFGDPPFLRR